MFSLVNVAAFGLRVVVACWCWWLSMFWLGLLVYIFGEVPLVWFSCI